MVLGIGQGDLVAVDPQAVATAGDDLFGVRMTVSEPVPLLGGTMVLSQPQGSGGDNPVRAVWSDGNVNVSARIAQDAGSNQNARFDRLAAWMAGNLQSMLNSIAAFDT